MKGILKTYKLIIDKENSLSFILSAYLELHGINSIKFFISIKN